MKSTLEIWRDIKDYEGLYQVSNLGRVKSLINNIILQPLIKGKGYFQVILHKNNEIRSYILILEICITSELGRVPTAKAGLAAIRTGEDYPCVGLK